MKSWTYWTGLGTVCVAVVCLLNVLIGGEVTAAPRGAWDTFCADPIYVVETPEEIEADLGTVPALVHLTIHGSYGPENTVSVDPADIKTIRAKHGSGGFQFSLVCLND